ncbi:MAG: small subunit ribosomal protein S5 [Candidatus Omnitrophota bacterium]
MAEKSDNKTSDKTVKPGTKPGAEAGADQKLGVIDPYAKQKRGGGARKPMRRRRREQRDSEFIEKVVAVNRVSKVVSGGKNFSFSALVVVGDGKGKVGFSIGKAREVVDAIQKGIKHAKNHIEPVPLNGTTIPHQVTVRFSAAKVFMKPASEGTGVIAGAAVRAVCECAGIKDILTKSLGSQTQLNVIQATIRGLREMVTKENTSTSIN